VREINLKLLHVGTRVTLLSSMDFFTNLRSKWTGTYFALSSFRIRN